MTQNKVNDKKLKQTMPILLTPPNLNVWDRNVQRERNDYRQNKFKKNNPVLEQQKFQSVVSALIDYKNAQESSWKGKRNHDLY
jgi:hypothetical protein